MIHSFLFFMYIKRILETQIEKVLGRPEIIAVVGARQVGKTTMINQFLGGLKNKKINSLNFDDLFIKNLFETDINSFIELYVKNYDILFIDEIQYVKDSGKILKYIYDTQKIKLIISGSSATELSLQSIKYLVGRVFVFTLFPFNFEEYLTSTRPDLVKLYRKGDYKLEIIQQLNKEKDLFLLYGGYPALVTEKDNFLKEAIIKNIYNTYLLREIKELLHLSENNKLIKLLKILAIQTGNIINYTDLSQETGFSQLTLKKYLDVLEQTFIIKLVSPFFTNKKKELVKNPKVYFIDSGFRNICLNNFSSVRVDVGILQEQFAISELIKKDLNPKFWNTKAKAEVDIIIESKNKLIPIEIKTSLSKPKTTRSFMNFLNEYDSLNPLILSNELEDSILKEKYKILFLPLVKFNIFIEQFIYK